MFCTKMIRGLLIAALLFPLAAFSAPVSSVLSTPSAARESTPSIGEIEMQYGAGKTADDTLRYSSRKLNKFKRPATRPTRQNFYVNWNPGRGVSKDSRLVFEYRQDKIKKTQVLVITYPFSVTEARMATFTIAEKAFRTGGPVTAWRVSLVEKNRTLAQKQSKNWR